MEINNMSLQVLVDGQPLREHVHAGKTYIEGLMGKDFTLRLRNNQYRKTLFVPTVDGLSIMDGKEASYSSDGYIIDGYRTWDIPGWRLDDSKVAKFFFGGKAEGYAPQVGKPQNVGVIGLAVFFEKPRHIQPQNRQINRFMDNSGMQMLRGCGGTTALPNTKGLIYPSNTTGGESPVAIQTTFTSSVSMDPAANQVQNVAAPINNLSTGFGAESNHAVYHVEFEQEPTPCATFELYYDTREGLMARGIILEASPNPFPAQKDPGCTPPAGWKG